MWKTLIPAVIGAASNVGSTMYGYNKQNEQLQEQRQYEQWLMRETNAMNRANFDYEFERESAPSQMALLRKAGVSASAAAQALSGGSASISPVSAIQSEQTANNSANIASSLGVNTASVLSSLAQSLDLQRQSGLNRRLTRKQTEKTEAETWNLVKQYALTDEQVTEMRTLNRFLASKSLKELEMLSQQIDNFKVDNMNKLKDYEIKEEEEIITENERNLSSWKRNLLDSFGLDIDSPVGSALMGLIASDKDGEKALNLISTLIDNIKGILLGSVDDSSRLGKWILHQFTKQ